MPNYTKLPKIGTQKINVNMNGQNNQIVISIWETDEKCVLDMKYKEKLWRIMSCSYISKSIDVIDTNNDSVITCSKCNDINWTTCIQPNIWYRITHHPSQTYLEVHSIIFHEIVHHGLYPPQELMLAVKNIQDVDLELNIAIKSNYMNNVINPDVWPIIHIQPMYYNYGIYCLASKNLPVSNIDKTDNNEVPERCNIVAILDNLAAMAYTDGSISSFQKLTEEEPSIGYCKKCNYVYNNSILIINDWKKKIKYRIDRATSHAIRQHKAWIPGWFIDFILYDVVV